MVHRTCSVADCDGLRVGRELCNKHYIRWQKYGNTDERIAPPFYLPDDNGCWIWQRELDTKGYGMRRVPPKHKKVQRAHRWVYEQHRGPISNGLELDHLCRVPACVNPDHLEPVTHRENVRRGSAPSAVAARTNRCIRGHEFTAENEYRNPNGKRSCRTCRRMFEGQKRPKVAA